MLISLIAWIYISLVCLVWGHLSLSVMTRCQPAEIEKIDPALSCLAGLSVVSTVALGLSLLMPLDWKAHCIVVLPALTWCARVANRSSIRRQLTQLQSRFSGASFCLLAASIFMIMAITSFKMTHPDTLEYHALAVWLFEHYRAIPGIANLKVHFGFQSSWFASLAIFKWSSPSFYNVIFLNGAVLCWFFIFTIQQITSCFSLRPGPWPKKQSLGWLLLLFYTFFSFTQVRLTAASASPDFIVTLYICAALFLFLQDDPEGRARPVYFSLIIFLATGAVLIKLSGIVVTLLVPALLFGHSRLRQVKWPILYAIAALMLLFTRNYIASGYPLYPLSQPDIGNVDWKMKPATLHQVSNYISMYARYPVDMKDSESGLRLPLTRWVPLWWREVSLPDKALLTSILAGAFAWILYGIACAKRGIYPQTWKRYRYRVALAVALIGCGLWFLQAPHPRFGSGFLLSLCYLLYCGLPFKAGRWLLLPMAWLLLATTAGYAVYRCCYFLTPAGMLRPEGISRGAYQPGGYGEIEVDLLHDRMKIKDSVSPAFCPGIGGFSPRGRSIRDGFRPPG